MGIKSAPCLKSKRRFRITCTALHETQPSKRVENNANRAITQKIRKAIHEDSTLSTYAHNIKIITPDGKVTLRGPVWSEDDKSNIEAKAVAGFCPDSCRKVEGVFS
jgi:osmotically-inducible protein OsmY